jgi:opacity protein-like surface antigen
MILFVVLLTVAGCQKVVAQNRWLLGTGVTYCSYLNSPGINVNISYRIIGNLHIGSDFSVLLSRETQEDGSNVKRKEVEYNLSSYYIFRINERVSPYPLVGINLSKRTVHREGKLPDKPLITAFNAVVSNLNLRQNACLSSPSGFEI